MFFHAVLTPNTIPKLKEAGKTTGGFFLESLIKTVCCDTSERFPVLCFGTEMTCLEVCPHSALAEAMQPAGLRCSLLSSFCPSSHCHSPPPPPGPVSRSLCTLCSQLCLWEPGTKQSFDFDVCLRCAQEPPATAAPWAAPLHPGPASGRGALPPSKPQCRDVTATPRFSSSSSTSPSM